MIRAGRATAELSRYGSPEFLAETDPVRIAASAVVAAECWAELSDEVAPRLRREIDTARAVNVEHDAVEHRVMAAGVRRLASVPTFEEVSRRRGEHDRADRARDRHAEIRRDADATFRGSSA